MKQIVWLLLLIVSSAYTQIVRPTTNPVIKGWYADPEANVFGKTYWIFPTYSAPSNQQVFFDAFSSKDFKTWKKHERILDTTVVKWAKRAMCAPSIIHKGNKYFLFYSANDIQEGEKGGIGVALSELPEGPYRAHLKKPLIGEFYNGAQPVDQFVFQDKDEQYYLIYGGRRHCNIVKLRPDFKNIVPFPDKTVFKEITPNDYGGGPFMFIRDNKYYFMWTEGDSGGTGSTVVYAISDSMFGPFEKAGIILEADPSFATGAGHHSIIKDADADHYYIVYHRTPLGETEPEHRVVCIDKLDFDAKGKILPVRMTK